MIHGIIVFYKQVSERIVAIGVLCDDNRYIKGYVQSYEAHYSIGQQIVAHFTPPFRFEIDSAENYMPTLFWHNKENLTKLMCVFNLAAQLPENMHFDGLYDKFLNIIARISIEQGVLAEWEHYVLNLL